MAELRSGSGAGSWAIRQLVLVAWSRLERGVARVRDGLGWAGYIGLHEGRCSELGSRPPFV